MFSEPLSIFFHIEFLVFICVVSNFLRVRVPYPFQWGSPTFDVGDVFGVMAAAYAALIEVTFSPRPVYLFIYWLCSCPQRY